MSITGAADGPPFRVGVAVGDIATGMFAVQGILAALVARGRTGRGQRVDIAMLDAITALLSYQASSAFATGETPARMGNRHPSIAPYDTFSAADGEFVLSVGNDEQFRRFAEVLGRPALAEDRRFRTNADRVIHHEVLRRELSSLLRGWRRDDLLAALRDAGVPGAAVRTITEALVDPQLAAREMVVPLEHVTSGSIRVLGTPLKLSATPASIRTPPPALGQHTAAILLELGLSQAQIAELKNAGAAA
jgi:crotonobetainyl-CoA:carnitine CoA-transferase CaiB-like acyl-CoA transferase